MRVDTLQADPGSADLKCIAVNPEARPTVESVTIGMLSELERYREAELTVDGRPVTQCGRNNIAMTMRFVKARNASIGASFSNFGKIWHFMRENLAKNVAI